MARAMCFLGIVIAILLVLLFGADAFLKVPFRGVSMVMNVAMIVAGLTLAYCSWSTLREQK
jgi:hypothetical protein